MTQKVSIRGPFPMALLWRVGAHRHRPAFTYPRRYSTFGAACACECAACIESLTQKVSIRGSPTEGLDYRADLKAHIFARAPAALECTNRRERDHHQVWCTACLGTAMPAVPNGNVHQVSPWQSSIPSGNHVFPVAIRWQSSVPGGTEVSPVAIKYSRWQ